MKNKFIKKVVSSLCATIMALSFVGCGNSTSTKSSEKDKVVLNIGDFSSWPTTSQVIVAEHNGYFKEEFEKDNIEVNIKRFLNGPAINEAFAAGAIDVGPVGEQPALTGVVNSKSLKIIAIAERAKGTQGLITSANSGITEGSQLKGKKIGVGIGTSSQRLLNVALNSFGFTEKDVQLINIPVAADARNSLLAGNVDAIWASEPNISQWIKADNVKILKDNSDFPALVVYEARTEYLKEHSDIVERYLKVLDKAYKWELEHPDETAAILAKASGLDEKGLLALLPVVDQHLTIEDSDIKGLHKAYDFLVENGLINQKINVDEYIDSSYVNKVVSKK